MKKEYIGITGIKNKQEISALADAYESSPSFGKAEHRLMLGILSSTKRLDAPFDEGRLSPAFYKIPELFESMNKEKKGFLFPMLHYHPVDRHNAGAEIKQVFEFRGIYSNELCRAVQINTDWPSAGQLELLKKSFPNLEIVIQLPNRVLDGISLNKVADKSKEYSGLADYVLIDPSGGKGIDFNPSDGVMLMVALKEALPLAVIGIAGGLGPDNVYNKVSVLKQSCSFDFSIDAQRKVVLLGDAGGVDLTASKEYINQAMDALSK